MQNLAETENRVSSKIEDPATEYARQVVDGGIIAGPHVRDACARHLRDLENQENSGLQWNLEQARFAIEFFEEILCLNGGQFEGEPFILLDWQLFILGSLFGWYGADGYRRFRMAYIETGKGSGKSPLAAGIGLYGLVADDEPRAEIYAAATKKDQAMILFRDAIAMVDQSEQLRDRLVKSGSNGKEWNLAYHAASSFFRPISSDNSQSGPRPHFALLDEVHEHKKHDVLEMMRAGTKSRRQALIFMITNSGTDRSSVCYDYHDYSRKVCAGQLEDDSFFGYVCALDEGDEPFRSESCWAKANPSLDYGVPGYKYIREQVTQARGMASKEGVVRRLNFCQWVDSDSTLISADAWFQCEDKEFDTALLRGRRCYGGLDLGSTLDLTACVLLFEPSESDPYWRQVEYFWIPGDGLAKKSADDRVPYDVWRNKGHISALPGTAVDKTAVAHKLVELTAEYEIQSIAFDRWRIKDLEMVLHDLGADIPLEPFGQGYQSMAPAVDKYETLIIGQTMRHTGNPCMNWNASNAVVETDPAGNRKLSKRKATGRIDGMVAAVMAAGATLLEEKQEPSVYETRGILSL